MESKIIEIDRNIENLSPRLRQSTGDVPIITVLLAVRSEDLLALLSIRDLLCDFRIILILPDRKKDTIAKGHTL